MKVRTDKLAKDNTKQGLAIRALTHIALQETKLQQEVKSVLGNAKTIKHRQSVHRRLGVLGGSVVHKGVMLGNEVRRCERAEKGLMC